MLLQSLLLVALLGHASAERCSFTGERKTPDGTAFIRCALGQTFFSGCVDDKGTKVSDGAEFDYASQSLNLYDRQRYRLRCSVTNTLTRSSVKATLVGCYDIEGTLVEKAAEYLWYNPFYRHNKYARFTRRCHEGDDGSFGFRNVACRGENDERIEFGESYRPKEDDPDFVFDCVGSSTKASFNLRGSEDREDSAESEEESLELAASRAAARRALERLLRGLGSGCRCDSDSCLSDSGKFFYRCEGSRPVAVACADEDGERAEPGSLFRSETRGQRFLLRCKGLINEPDGAGISVEMEGCYDSAGALKKPGQEFAWYKGSGDGLIDDIGFTKLCENKDESYSGRTVACAGRNGTRVEVGEDYAPLPELLPGLVFQCRQRDPGTFSFHRKPDCSDSVKTLRCLAEGEATGRSTVECVPRTWRCDGDNDCGNGKDEEDC